MTTVSVLLPVFNGEPFLRQAIESILAQTVQRHRAADRRRRLDRFVARDDPVHRRGRPAIRFESRANRGLVATLNELLDRATSPFIARMDADDVAAPERFARQLAEFERDEGLLAVGSDVWSIDSAGRRLMTIRMPHSHQLIDDHTMEVVHGSGNVPPVDDVPGDGVRAGRAAIAKSSGRPRMPTSSCGSPRRAGSPTSAEPLLSYRVHGDSIGHRQAERQRDALFRAARGRRRAPRNTPPGSGVARASCPPEEQHRDVASARDTKWAWWALKEGNVRTARSLAARAVLRRPFAKDSWRVLACAIRGY
jgi:hypothetical protein